MTKLEQEVEKLLKELKSSSKTIAGIQFLEFYEIDTNAIENALKDNSEIIEGKQTYLGEYIVSHSPVVKKVYYGKRTVWVSMMQRYYHQILVQTIGDSYQWINCDACNCFDF